MGTDTVSGIPIRNVQRETFNSQLSSGLTERAHGGLDMGTDTEFFRSAVQIEGQARYLARTGCRPGLRTRHEQRRAAERQASELLPPEAVTSTAVGFS